jgi:hypothetical protein
MHPSYRDLVIDELASQAELRTRFLQRMSLQGIKLAISDSGGAEGNRVFPLMADSKSWELLRERCVQIVDNTDVGEISDLLTILSNAIARSKSQQATYELKQTLSAVCDATRAKWDRTRAIFDPDDFLAYCRASLLITPLPPLPRVEASWNAHVQAFRDALTKATTGEWLSPDLVQEWAELLQAVNKNEPRFLRQVGFPEAFKSDVEQLIEVVTGEIAIGADEPSYEDLKSEADRLEILADCVESLEDVIPALRTRLRELRASLAEKIESLEEEASHLSHEPDFDDNEDRYPSEEFDIEALFEDL